MLVKTIKGTNYLYCEKCEKEFAFNGNGGAHGHICPKCGHGNVLLIDPDFFTKLNLHLGKKRYKPMNFVGLKRDDFYSKLDVLLKEEHPVKYDVYETENHPNYNFLAVLLIEVVD